MHNKLASLSVLLTTVLFSLLGLGAFLALFHHTSLQTFVIMLYSLGALFTTTLLQPHFDERFSLRKLQQYPSRQLWMVVKTYFVWPFVLFGVASWLNKKM